MNKPLPYSVFSSIAETLLKQTWIFAKTMPDNPHWYCLRKNFKNEKDFISVVENLRKYSYGQKYRYKIYQCFNVNEHFYWTMGAPISKTILINRKILPETPYDKIAEQYDSLFLDPESRKENEDVIRLINYSGGSVLEIGCASCPIMEKIKIIDYCGIDPSAKMISISRKKYPDGLFIQTDFESFYSDRGFDNIIATFGAASYIHPDYITKIEDLINKGGKLFLMFYKNGYFPKTYEKTGIFTEWYKDNFIKINNAEVIEYHNYIILRAAR